MKISKKVAGVEYAIRDIVSAARSLESSGKRITYLNIGDPVQYGFQPPENVKQALTDAVNRGLNHYSQSEGLPDLREAIAIKEAKKGLRVSGDRILVTSGISEALDMVIASIVEEGDEVLLPGPYYPPYASYVRLHGGKPVEFYVDQQTQKPDILDIRDKITPRTVAICLLSPNNPTGVVFDGTTLKSIVDVAGEFGLYVLCDEIYDQIVFDQRFFGIGSVAGDSPVIVLNGFSKVHLMSGWRIGYLAFNDSPKLEPLMEHLPKLARVRISANTPVQYAALESLKGPQDYIGKFVSELRRRRDHITKRLDEISGLSCPVPSGAFYLFPKIEDNPFKTDREFVLELLRSEGILTVHGSGFGEAYGRDHFRMVFLPDIKTLDAAAEAISSFMSKR